MIESGEGDGDSQNSQARDKADKANVSDLESGRDGSPDDHPLVEKGNSVSLPVSYSNVLIDGSSLVEESPDFEVKDGVAEVTIPGALMEGVEPLWGCYVVGYFMHDAPHIGSIHATVNRIWASPLKNNKIDVQFIGKTTVLFRIEDAGIRSRVIKRKFWHISDVPLMVGEWTPETARAPPDLSAMPLWVDLLNVPGYLYSKKGLSFLSRTAGKFLKLHTNTERCVRLDVARVLVEVDLTKPLPNMISFKGREGTEVVVSISYPWLPPRCSLCSKWGHNSKDCHSKGKESERSVKDSSVLEKVVAGNDYVVMEGFSTKDASEKSASEIVNKLMEELETMPGKASLSGGSNTASAVGLVESSHSVVSKNESWALVPITNHGSSSPPRAIRTVGCSSPNGFQVLQDIREEGEIDEEDDDKKYADETGILTNSMGESLALVETAVNSSVGEAAAGSTLKQGPIQRGKGKGSKRVIVNSRDLVQAVAQQQKVQHQ
ncbi:hypothetical protein Bca4012_044042 [Brassica carinata]|uniref:DUF4283 domain-containing protein n=1 Tax=Brassica carinata TaxID=52824 RepID=A0A8X7QTE2_BRACI|nr:hypothetical protein Bca52824_058386 [Brassica carinata]